MTLLKLVMPYIKQPPCCVQIKPMNMQQLVIKMQLYCFRDVTTMHRERSKTKPPEHTEALSAIFSLETRDCNQHHSSWKHNKRMSNGNYGYHIDIPFPFDCFSSKLKHVSFYDIHFSCFLKTPFKSEAMLTCFILGSTRAIHLSCCIIWTLRDYSVNDLYGK